MFLQGAERLDAPVAKMLRICFASFAVFFGMRSIMVVIQAELFLARKSLGPWPQGRGEER